METVRAMVMTAPGAPLEMRQFPLPRAAPGGAIVETLMSEVCGTDVHLHHGQLAGVPYPIIPGHVSCGRLLELGGALTDVEGRALAVGQLVTFYDVFGICGACWHCLVARAGTRCPHRRVYGITTARAKACSAGGRTASSCGPVCASFPCRTRSTPWPSWAGAAACPRGSTPSRGRGVALGDRVVVQGSGPVGLNAAIFAALSGAASVLMVGAPAARLQAALRLGVDDVPDLAEAPQAADRVAWVRARTSGRGADVVIEATGNPAAFPEGLEMLRDAGRYVMVGQYTDAGDATLNPHPHVNRRHATILGCWGYEFTHLHRSLALLARHAAPHRLGGAGDAASTRSSARGRRSAPWSGWRS